MTITPWAHSVHHYTERERRYTGTNALAARVTHIAGKTIDGVLRPWRMMVYRDGATGPCSWWHYATRDEAIAGADDELSAIVPGLER